MTAKKDIPGAGQGGPYEDFPFFEVAKTLNQRQKEGFTFFQKFSCSGCGQRLTMDRPDTLYTKGVCDRCPEVTDIAAQGCNYLLIKV